MRKKRRGVKMDEKKEGGESIELREKEESEYDLM
jgi:hypothetical protein